MPAPKGNRYAANRPNAKKSGRKPKAVTLAKRALMDRRIDDAEYAIDLHIQTMRDEKLDRNLRLGAAQIVMAEVWGKPRQQIEHTGEDGEAIKFVIEPYDGTPTESP